jgi:Zn-dependent protease/CBS domain-containing protein
MLNRGVSIGHLFDINIRIDWSWLLIFLLVTWNLGFSFGAMRPEWGATLQWGLAIAASLLFFASVLAHELSHSLMAKAQGLQVRNITLFLFGGVANIDREPPSPRAEFLITIVGPITSVVLGIIFLLLGGLWTRVAVDPATVDPMAMVAQLGPAETLLLWLGSINIILGIFNMIPGFPLDGGRILRSILWALTNNLRRATRWASWVGQLVAWLLIGTGVAMIFGVTVPIFGTGFLGGIWLIFIGWFLNSAAIQSYQQVVIQDILEDVPVARLMRIQPPTVSVNASIDTLVHEHVMRTDDHAFPVLADGGRLAGLVTLEDIRTVARDGWTATTVQEIMTPVEELATVRPEDDASRALNLLGQHDVRQLPVVRNGDLEGILRRRDIVRWLQLHSEEMAA